MIILLVPTYNSSDIFDGWAEAIYKLNPKPDKVIFLENNSTDNTLKKLTQFKLPHEIIRIWVRDNAAKQNPYTVIAHVRQLLLTRARQIDSDFAVFLDDDIIVETPTMISILTGWNRMLKNAHIIGGTYLRRFPRGIFIASKWKLPSDKGKYRLYRYPPKKILSEPHVTSCGCLCLSRKIIQDRRVNFIPLFSPRASEDFGYCAWARKYGYKIYLDHTIKLRHINDERNVNTNRPWTAESIENNKKKFVDFTY